MESVTVLLQFSKAKAPEQRSGQFTATIRLMVVRESHNQISLPSAWQWKRRATWQTQKSIVTYCTLGCSSMHRMTADRTAM